MLPIRPNESTAWTRGDGVELGQTDYRLVVDLERLRIRLLVGAAHPRRSRSASARGTPRRHAGTFFLSLLRSPDPDSVYGAYAFGRSAYSDVITDWEGVRGTPRDERTVLDRPSGEPRMHRVRKNAIRRFARLLPLGTPIGIA